MNNSTLTGVTRPLPSTAPVTIARSKLSQHHPKLAGDVDALLAEAQRLGASSSVQRIALVCDQYDKLSPDAAYRWIDPVGFQHEVEDNQARKGDTWHIIRNCVSLLPLIFTWFALFSAASSYHDCLTANQCEITTPFLALWQQDGFAHRTFTFASAALLDVTLLMTYLLLILVTHWLDKRAYTTSTAFARKMRVTTEDLMKVIADDGVTPVASEADVDKVSHAVQRVVDRAAEMSKQAAQSAEETSQKILQATQQSTQQAITTAQQAIQEIVQASQQSMQQMLQTTQQSIAASNGRVETLFTDQIIPMMTSFHKDMGMLHMELDNYQDRLDDLTGASKQLADVSVMLATNADRYITIGQDINTQIGALNKTQQDVLQNIGAIAGNISAAAQNMSAATTSMGNATKAVETVATQLTTGMQVTINTMTTQVGRATQSLGQVGNELQTTTVYLQKAAMLLSSLQFGSGGGLIGWFVRNRANRRRGMGVQNP